MVSIRGGFEKVFVFKDFLYLEVDGLLSAISDSIHS